MYRVAGGPGLKMSARAISSLDFVIKLIFVLILDFKLKDLSFFFHQVEPQSFRVWKNLLYY